MRDADYSDTESELDVVQGHWQSQIVRGKSEQVRSDAVPAGGALDMLAPNFVYDFARYPDARDLGEATHATFAMVWR